LSHSYAKSIYTESTRKGSEVVGYYTSSDFFVTLAKLIEQTPGKAFIYAYLPLIDTAEYIFGPWSEEVEGEISLVSYKLNEFLQKINPKVASSTALIITADHGQVEIDPTQTIYLDQIPGFVDNLQVSPNGKIIPPAGGARDVHLHIKGEKLDETIKLLENFLKEKAVIQRVDEAIKEGLFGNGKIDNRFLDRIGNLLILPTRNYTVWYHFAPDLEMVFRGYHGELSEDEELIPFICTKIADLQQ
jgi:predicted AlkP superfamily pyrophosphatase or phosphodiesterase